MTDDENTPENCSVCGKPAKVEIKGKTYGPYWDDDGEEVACIYCAASDMADDFYAHDGLWSPGEETVKELLDSGVLYMASKERPA